MKTSTNASPLRAALDKFLNSPEGEKILARVAKSVPRQFPGPKDGNPSIKDMKQDIVLFLIDNIDALKFLLSPDNLNPEAYLFRAINNSIIDRMRQSPGDTYWHLRDYIMRSIRISPRFHRKTAGKTYLFSIHETNRDITPISREELLAIPMPETLPKDTTSDSLRDNRIMPDLAEYFWRSVSEMRGFPRVWVPILDLLRWIRLHLSEPRARLVTLDDEKGKRLIDLHGPTVDVYFDPDRVRIYARLFSNRLDDRLKPSFRLHYCEGVEFTEMSDIMGYSNQTARNHINRCHECLKDYLRDLRWLSPDDLVEPAFDLFLDILCQNLENSAPAA